MFSSITKLLGRIETQTRDMMYCQTIRTVRERHLPRRSSKNCDLQFANTDRFRENYSIEIASHIRLSQHNLGQFIPKSVLCEHLE